MSAIGAAANFLGVFRLQGSSKVEDTSSHALATVSFESLANNSDDKLGSYMIDCSRTHAQCSLLMICMDQVVLL